MAPDRHAEVTDRTLRFSEDGTFQISVFEDLHFAEGNFRLQPGLRRHEYADHVQMPRRMSSPKVL